jgi:predicted transcriptional regulator
MGGICSINRCDVVFLVTTANYDSEVDSASIRNEYQEYFLGGKAAGA